MNTVTKSYRDLPAAHRQPNHDGHCRLIHGHNFAFDITFGCNFLDENGFVVDVGKLEEVKAFLVESFDHTLLLNSDDPRLEYLVAGLTSELKVTPGGVGEEDTETVQSPVAKIVFVPNCGMEGLAKWVFEEVQGIVTKQVPGAKERGLLVVEVVCWEDSKNRATYRHE